MSGLSRRDLLGKGALVVAFAMAGQAAAQEPRKGGLPDRKSVV